MKRRISRAKYLAKGTTSKVRYGQIRVRPLPPRRNPGLGSIGTVVVLGAAAYGGYQLVQSVRGQPLDRTSCETAGGTWKEFGPIGYCEMPPPVQAL